MMETTDHAFMKVNAIVILLGDIVSLSRDFSVAHRAQVWGKKNKTWMRPLPKSTSFLSVRAVIWADQTHLSGFPS